MYNRRSQATILDIQCPLYFYVVSLSNHAATMGDLQPSFDKLRTVLGKSQTGVKHGSLPSPSVGLNTTFTFWPTPTFAGSTSTMLVIMDTPSSSVT